MQRKLAVPLVLSGSTCSERAPRMRSIKGLEGDCEDLAVLTKLAENRSRIEKLIRDVDSEPELEDVEDIACELDYLKASVQLGLLEITGELEETKTSEEIFDSTLAEA